MLFDRRCYSFSKTTNILTSHWLTPSLNRRERVSLPTVFSERQKIEEAFNGEFTTVEMVKRDGEWYAHFLLKRTIEVPDKPKTLIAIDRGKHNLAVAISKSNLDKPMKGRLWRGQEIKQNKKDYTTT
jgi:transposase